MVANAVEGSDASTLTVLRDHVSTLGPGWGDLAALVAFHEALQGGERARSAFTRLVERLAEHPASADTPVIALEPLCDAVTNILASDHRRGRPWKLRGNEQQALGRVPYLRATYLRRGRLGTHPPLLDKRHLSDEARSADAAEILSVAISRGDQDLAEQTAARMKASEFDTPQAHAPAHLGVRSSEEIAQALGRGSAPAGLCWMA